MYKIDLHLYNVYNPQTATGDSAFVQSVKRIAHQVCALVISLYITYKIRPYDNRTILSQSYVTVRRRPLWYI